MSFNVNYLAGTYEGIIPLNIDSWQKANGKFADRYIEGRPINDLRTRYSTPMFYTSNLFEAYWTVRSFKIDFRILVNEGPSSLGGGAISIGEALGNLAGLGSSSNLISAKGYTKIFHRHYKTITKGPKPPQSLEPNEKVSPNPKEALIFKSKEDFKPNEGTLVSPGPIHVFVNKQRNVSVRIDFSDIIYRQSPNVNLHYPKISIIGSNSKFSFSVGPSIGRNSSLHYVFFMGSLIPVSVTTFGSNPLPPSVIFNCSIEPGDRCCDRFFWDGKDKKRAQTQDCESCSDFTSTSPSASEEELKKEGVYASPELAIAFSSQQ
jgi:hypothetical protein